MGCGRADRRAGVSVRKADAFPGNRIDVWCADLVRTVNREIVIPEIGDQDDDDVRPIVRDSTAGGGASQYQANEKYPTPHARS